MLHMYSISGSGSQLWKGFRKFKWAVLIGFASVIISKFYNFIRLIYAS